MCFTNENDLFTRWNMFAKWTYVVQVQYGYQVKNERSSVYSVIELSIQITFTDALFGTTSVIFNTF